ncbi:MAG TPA: hypothetical protein VMS81_04760 [Methanomicrobiales archaeon]|jgi:hypothetical protein|nr:hypothetical protein [Methanomicrobiales archaeon]
MAGEAKPEKEKGPKTEGEKAPEKAPVKTEEKAPRRKLTRVEKQAQHMDRLKKTTVACAMGIVTGVLSFYVDAPQTGTALGILFLLAGIVFQKYVFLALRMDYLGLTSKDWLYQGFMTFALWFITWTILLSSR